ncbi:uncharacterized protein LOC126265328 [Aethina tumida]|uniref:uncharacterized protein LOC126265328 n=1 Tax=Aethina tumida TaxID=116153 RepID=UPI00214908DE|nr:uncharacterized protein LOC126265328 [Aethina tumida]
MDQRRKRRRGVRNDEEYKRHKIKKSRVHGKAYQNYRDKPVDARKIGQPCKCIMRCFDKIKESDRQKVFAEFYKLSTKNLQDIYLQSLIQAQSPTQRRKRKEDGKDRSWSYRHYITINKNDKRKVCRGAFVSIFGITSERLRRLKRLKVQNELPQDKRGTHNNRNKIESHFDDLIRKHLLSYPIKAVIHSNEIFIDTSLTIKQMYQEFMNKNKKIKNINRIKYSYFYKYYTNKMDPKICKEKPQYDICCECEELALEIKQTFIKRKRENLQTLRDQHNRKAQSFLSKYNTVKEELEKDTSVGAVAFAFLKTNLHLPKTPVADYLKQGLKVHLFRIYDLKMDKSYYYIYPEVEAQDGPNEVCSFLRDYLQNHLSAGVKRLCVFSDGQSCNKNETIISMWLSLTKKFDKIEHFYPITGHTNLPCDIDCNNLQKVLGRHLRIFRTHKYTELIANGNKKSEVREVQRCDIFDYESWHKNYFVNRFNEDKLEGVCHLVFEAGSFKAGRDIEKEFEISFKYIGDVGLLSLPEEYAYGEPLRVDEEKVDNLKRLIEYVDDNINFYSKIIQDAQ